jgi:hypothetical protein
LFFFFLLECNIGEGSFCKCTIRQVHDSSLSHSKPFRYGWSSSSSACDICQHHDRTWAYGNRNRSHSPSS